MSKNSSNRILIIDDDKRICETYSDLLCGDYSVLQAYDFSRALRVFRSENPSVVLLDYHLGDCSALELLQEFQEQNAAVPVIVVTGDKEISRAVEAVKYGAYDFLHKPLELRHLRISVDRAYEYFCLKNQLVQLDSALDLSSDWILGQSTNAKQLMRKIQQVAKSNFSILLEGETGTGKTFIANLIHQFSDRAQKPFIKIDIGSIPEGLVEKELFGNERGAYTGADKQHIGYFEAAHEGTLFIDELENMTPFIQSKLLTVIEDKELQPLGSRKKRACNFRLICATNQHISDLIERGQFREDLVYRFAEYSIQINPLRERQEDIFIFAKRFLVEANDEMGKKIRSFSEGAIQKLRIHKWPGNIRELKAIIRKAVLICDSQEIQSSHLQFFKGKSIHPAGVQRVSETGTSMRSFVSTAEIQAISQALQLTAGNKSQAAKILQISYKTLLSKIKEYSLR